MVSRKNINYKAQQDAKYVPHYGIRKLSIGVASVLLGTAFYMQNGTVHADVNPSVSTGNDSVNVVNRDSGTSGSPVASSTLTGVSSVSSMVSTDDATNLTVSSQTSGSPVEGATKQANNSAWVASELGSAVPASRVNVGTDTSNAISSLPPASHHQPSATGGNPNNDQQSSFDVSKSLNQSNLVGLEQSNVQENSNIAKNVKGQWIWNNGQTPSTTSVSEQTIGGNYEYRMGARFSFDVDGSQLKQGDIIDIAHISQTSSNSGMAAFNSENADVPVLIDGRKIGYLSLSADTLPGDPNVNSFRFSRLNYRLRVTEPNLNYQGIQHVSVVAPWLGTLNYYSTWSFRGVKDSLVDFHFYGDGLDEHYKVHYSWPDNLDFGLQHQMGYSVYVAGGSFLSDNGCTDPTIIFQNPLLKFANSSQLGLFNQSAGKQGSIDVTNKSIDYGMRFYLDHGNSVLLSNVLPNLNVQFSFPVVNSDGSIVSSSQYPAYNLMDTRYMTLKHNFQSRVVASNLTLLQLKKLNAIGAVISRQSDGSALVYYHFPLADMQMDFSKINDYVLQRMISMSPYINYSTNSYADAIAMAKRMFATWSSPSMQSIPTGFSVFINWIYASDPSTHPSMHVELLDPDTGNVLQNSVEPGNYSTVISHGQSTVKLHVITPSGVALQQVKSFTDWPNQNKHVSLSIPSITGYELVSNPQSVLSALHLSGTSILSAQQVDYPTENTVADYYVVLQPKMESASVQIVDADESNKVLATGTVSGRFGEPIVSSADIQSKLDSLMKTGHYTLASNGFDSGTDYKDGTNTVTISLKHKLDSTQRHYRVIEDLPDGMKKVIVDYQITFYKDAASKYYNRMGAVTVDTLKLLKPNSVQMNVANYSFPNDNTSVYSAIDEVPGYSYQMIDGINFNSYPHGVNCRIWTNSQMAPLPPTTFNKADFKDLVIFDLFLGGSNNGGTDLVSNLQNIGCVENPLASRDFHIEYSRNSYPVTVNYYDIDGKLVDSVTSMHKFGDTVSIAPVAPTNYVLVSGQSKTDYLMRLGLNEVDFLVEPKLTTTVETKTVSRTITVQTPDGQTNNVVQTVTFVRNGYLNQVTKQTTYSPWSFGGQYQFSGYWPKPIAGYTTDVVPAVIVTPDSLSTTVSVAYHQIPVVYEINYRLSNGTVVKNVSATPERDGMIHLTAPQGYRLLTTVTDIQVGHSSQKLTVLVLPDEQTYTAYSVLPSIVTDPLTKTITRTINITMPNGRVRRVVQQVHFVRTATVVANGKVTYSDWTGVGQTSFDRLFVPKRRGYQLVMTDKQGQTLTGVNQMVVDPTMDDAVINIKYVK